MAPKKKKPLVPSEPQKVPKPCLCGDNCHEPHAHLPGFLLIALGFLVLPLNYGLVANLEWARAWPLAIVLVGCILVVKVTICRKQS